ncbi:S26 family signal peptidase [Cellvibrio sp. NN19]|uniref:S26 family signal peptidase n=1 Tax=Cellvibrio chitinivorans TaxID=3102792 RepID=UPI002B40344A|nr:S26 family signal peptidase [Cellvibrio sp. NN19]
MKTTRKILTITLLGFSYLLPASTLILQKRYKYAAFCFFCLFILFSTPAWLRLWSSPVGFLLSLVLVVLVWTWFYLVALRKSANNIVLGLPSLLRITLCCFIYPAIIVVGILLSKWLLGYQLFHVPTPSMTPTLIPGDYVLTDTWAQNTKKSDIVVFNKFQRAYTVFNVKRITHSEGDIFHEKVLSDSQVAVMGDNRDNSEDSRVFGAINKSDIVGKVVWIAFSYDAQSGYRRERFFNTLSK